MIFDLFKKKVKETRKYLVTCKDCGDQYSVNKEALEFISYLVCPNCVQYSEWLLKNKRNAFKKERIKAIGK